jgi:glucose/arabinose dehydrogenase
VAAASGVVLLAAGEGVVAACSAGVESSRIRDTPRNEIAANFETPWGIAFLPDGGALVTERDTKRIYKLGPARQNGRLVTTQVATIDDADPSGEGGLLGIAVSPDYESDRLIFIYYTAADDNRIARMRLGDQPEPIVTGIPKASVHNGGRLGFGPDGFLYASTGDGTQRELAQDKSSLAGKILRMRPDGSAAPGNPFGNLVYSYGHRNVQGFAWTNDGVMYATEFGQNDWDELNRIRAGGNYGWPEVEGDGGQPQYIDPLVVWRPSEASPSGMAAEGSNLVIACLRGERLFVVDVRSSAPTPHPVHTGAYGRLRTVVVAPSGAIWFTTSNRDGRGAPARGDDRILQYNPTPATFSQR